jgi:hypothetical protein
MHLPAALICRLPGLPDIWQEAVLEMNKENKKAEKSEDKK